MSIASSLGAALRFASRLVISGLVLGINVYAPLVLAQVRGIALDWQMLSAADYHLALPAVGSKQTNALVLDVDGDGLNDFAIGGNTTSGPSLVWYHRHASGWTRHVIEPDPLHIEAGGTVADVDGDGDPDIIIGGDYLESAVWWWENPYPAHAAGVRWTRRALKASGPTKHHDVVAGDVDGDGALEVVFWNQGGARLVVAEAPPHPRSAGEWAQAAIFTWTDDKRYEGLAVADVDVDGTLDIVGGGLWFRHEGGGVYSAHVIDEAMDYSRTAVGQLVPGGRPEIVLGCGDCDGPLHWYAWSGDGWIPRPLLRGPILHGHSLAVADVNGDGHQDVFAAEMRLNDANPAARTMLFYGDGAGGFTQHVLAVGYCHHESKVADLDGDGDLDILGKPYNWRTPGLFVWLNGGTSGGARTRWTRRVIGSGDYRLISIGHGDLDGDGRPDLVTGGWWFANPGTPTAPWTRFTLPELGQYVAALDADGDGDLDLLGTRGIGSAPSAAWLWLENLGQGASWQVHPIDETLGGTFVQGAVVGAFGTGPPAVAVSWHDPAVGVQLLQPPGSPGGAWTMRVISWEALGEDLSAGDIDRDGDLDLLLGTTWLENPAPAEGLWPAHELAPAEGEPDRNALADVDGDGDLDAVVGYEFLPDIVWFEAPADTRGAWTRHLIATDMGGGFSLDAGDVDGDGDPDVVVGEHQGAHRVVWLENQQRGAGWTLHVVDDGASGHDHHAGTQLADLEGQRRPSIYSIGWDHGDVLLYTPQDAEVPRYRLTVEPVGHGAVAPAGGTYPQGSTVTLYASPAAGQTFSGWGGDASGLDNPLTLTMTRDMHVVAAFRPLSAANPYHLHLPGIWRR